MARIRTIKPDFWDDEKVGQLPRDARLLFVATWNVADDEGLLRWTPEYLKSVAFIYDDDISVTDTAELMRQLSDAGFVLPYTAGPTKQRLAYIINFRKHQKVNRPQPSKLTPPSLSNTDVAAMYLRRDGWICHLCGGPIPSKYQIPLIDPYSADGPADTQPVNPSLDHVIPRVAGGSDYPSNIRIAHISCNKARRERGVDNFEAPSSVVRALEYLERVHPDQLISSVTGAVNGSLNDSLNEVAPSVADDVILVTPSGIPSLNGSLTSSLPEGKGREGKGLQPTTATPSRSAPPDDHGGHPTAQTLVAEWIDHCTKRPPGNVIGHTSKAIKTLLEEGIDPVDVRNGLALWAAKGLHPSALPSVVNERMNARPDQARRANRRPSTDDKVAEWQRLKTGTDGGATIYELSIGDSQ